LWALYKKSLAGLFIVLTPAAVLLALVAYPFLSLWAGPEYGAYSTGPLLVALAGAWLGCLAWVPQSYLVASGRAKAVAYIRLAEVGPYLTGAWVLTARFGATGAAAAWAAGLGLYSLTCLAVVWRMSRLPFLPLSERRWRCIAGYAALGLAVVLAAKLSHGLALRVGWAAVLGLAYGAATWSMVLSPRERDGLFRLAADALRRGPPPRHRRHAA
ncbi:MAG: polysaccharide biosynthesis C-terminal domain-containing protein, partial [bacterium]